MKLLPILIPIILIQITLLVIALINLIRKKKTHYLSKNIWLVIVILINIIGPIIYLILEGKEEDESN